MKKLLILLHLVFALAQLVSAQSIHGPSSLSFRIKQITNKKIASNDLVIELEFRNTSKEPIKIMAAVGAVKASSLNLLSISLRQKKEKPIEIQPPAKVDYGAASVYEYVTILPGKSYKKVLNINKLIQEKSISFKPGEYKLEMYYYNQHGDNCMKGVFPSNAMQVHLAK